MNDPKPTEVYRHWKTRDLYCVVGVSRDSEDWDNDDARCVVYTAAEAENLYDQLQLFYAPKDILLDDDPGEGHFVEVEEEDSDAQL